MGGALWICVNQTMRVFDTKILETICKFFGDGALSTKEVERGLFRFLLKKFPVCFNLFVLLFLVTPYLVVAVQPCME